MKQTLVMQKPANLKQVQPRERRLKEFSSFAKSILWQLIENFVVFALALVQVLFLVWIFYFLFFYFLA